ncbi:hypothetical protein M3148_16430, partial [Georgenia satyanarayanai]|uniref:hypothetical protein n=1 Tax=Georgenia satyanarayanai TaxID=860221 RepID=UPI00203AC4EE
MTDAEDLIGRPGELHIGIFAQDQVWVDVRGVPHALEEMTLQYRANVIRHLREHAAQYRRAVASGDAIDGQALGSGVSVLEIGGLDQALMAPMGSVVVTSSGLVSATRASR